MLESSIHVWALLRHKFHMSSPLTQACLQAGSRHISWRPKVLEEEKDEMYVLIQPQRHLSVICGNQKAKQRASLLWPALTIQGQ